MNPPVSLRTATLSDAPAITSLINLAFQVERFFIPGGRIPRSFATGRFIEP